MKNTISLLTILAFSTPVVAKNIIQNPSFEDSQNFAWQFYNSPEGGYARIDSTDHLPHFGTHSGLTNSISGGFGKLFQDMNYPILKIPQIPPGSGLLSWWYKVKKIAQDGGADFYLQVYAVGNGEIHTLSYWCHDKSYLNPPPGAYIEMPFGVFSDTTGWLGEMQFLYGDWIGKGLPPTDTIQRISLFSDGVSIDSIGIRGQQVNWDNLWLDAPVGIEEKIERTSNFKICPEITCSFVNYESAKPFSVFDAAGRKLFTKQGKNQLLLPKAGVYFFKQDSSIIKVVVTG